jgi:hypothetical protein
MEIGKACIDICCCNSSAILVKDVPVIQLSWPVVQPEALRVMAALSGYPQASSSMLNGAALRRARGMFRDPA